MPFSYIKEVILLKKYKLKFPVENCKIFGINSGIYPIPLFQYFLKTENKAEFFHYLCSAIWTRHCTTNDPERPLITTSTQLVV